MTWRGCKCIKYRTTNSSSRLWRYLQRTPLPPSTTYSRCWMTLPSPSGYSLSLPHSLYDVDLFNTSFLFFHLLLQAAHQEVVKMRVGCCAAFSFLPFFIYFFFIHVASGTEWPNQTRNEQRCGWTEDQTGHEAKSTSCLVHCFEDGLKPPIILAKWNMNCRRTWKYFFYLYKCKRDTHSLPFLSSHLDLNTLFFFL